MEALWHPVPQGPSIQQPTTIGSGFLAKSVEDNQTPRRLFRRLPRQGDVKKFLEKVNLGAGILQIDGPFSQKRESRRRETIIILEKFDLTTAGIHKQGRSFVVNKCNKSDSRGLDLV